MITPMKKLELMVHHRDRKKVTQSLEQLGVLHLDIAPPMANERIQQLEAQRELMLRGIKILEAYQPLASATNPDFSEKKTSEDVLMEIDTLEKEIATLESDLEEDKKQYQVAHQWGISKVEVFEKLQETGLRLRLYVGNVKAFDRYDFEGKTIQVIWRNSKRIGFTWLDSTGSEKLPFEEIKFPTVGFATLAKYIAEKKNKIEKLKQQLKSFVPYIVALKLELSTVHQSISFEKTMLGYDTHAEGNLISLVGWFPQSTEASLLAFLKSSEMAWSVSVPSAEERPPIVLKNNRYSKLFEPITNIFQLPHYFELDLTPFIAVFYPLFFAYCLGDAGYGVVLLLLSLVSYFTIFKTSKHFAILGIILGLMTALMGIVKSGTVFGIPTLESTDIAFFQFLSTFVYIHDDQSFILNAFNVAIMVGVVQIIVAIILSIYKEATYVGLVAALAPLGKFFIVIGVLSWFLYNSQGVEALAAYQNLASFMMIAGMLMFLIFKNLKESIGMRLGGNLLPLFFIFTNILGDILSYVRLFALGVASAVLGLVVNQIGMQIWEAGWYGIIIGPVFLLFGHSLNMGLAVLGAFVHPLRLTFVEFYNNAQFEGGGQAYAPFGKKTPLSSQT